VPLIVTLTLNIYADPGALFTIRNMDLITRQAFVIPAINAAPPTVARVDDNIEEGRTYTEPVDWDEDGPDGRDTILLNKNKRPTDEATRYQCMTCQATTGKGTRCTRITCTYAGLCWQHSLMNEPFVIAQSTLLVNETSVGLGLFTNSHFPEGMIVTYWIGVVVNADRYDAWHENINNEPLHRMSLRIFDQDSDGVYEVVARSTQTGANSRWINRVGVPDDDEPADTVPIPNLSYSYEYDGDSVILPGNLLRVALRATKPIWPGEELLLQENDDDTHPRTPIGVGVRDDGPLNSSVLRRAREHYQYGSYGRNQDRLDTINPLDDGDIDIDQAVEGNVAQVGDDNMDGGPVDSDQTESDNDDDNIQPVARPVIRRETRAMVRLRQARERAIQAEERARQAEERARERALRNRRNPRTLAANRVRRF